MRFINVNLFCGAEYETVEPESVAYRTSSKHTTSSTKRHQRHFSYAASRDGCLPTENGLRRETLRRRSGAAEDLYCPMNGGRIDSGKHPPATDNGHAVHNAPISLVRACSDDTLHSDSRRLRQTNHHVAVKATPIRGDQHISALDIAANTVTHRSRGSRDGRRRRIVPHSVTSRRSRGTAVGNRPDLLCTWKDPDDGDYMLPRGCGAAKYSRPQQCSPQDDLPKQLYAAAYDDAADSIPPAITQSPPSAVSEGSPDSQYPIAPAASPVTANSRVFNPPPCAVVSSSAISVCPTTASIPSRPVVTDSLSNPDSGYGSKIYRCRGAGLAVDPVATCQEHHLVTVVEAGLTGVCSSFPDVVVDRPAFTSGQVATLPRATSGRRCCQSSVVTPPPSLDLVTYGERNWVVSPRRTDHRQLRVPIQLADENSTVKIGEPFSPMSLLSFDSVDFVAEKVSDCILSSPTDDVPIESVLCEVESCSDVQRTPKFFSTPQDKQLCNDADSECEADSRLLGIVSLNSITTDARETAAFTEISERESYPKPDSNYTSPPISAFDHVSGTAVSSHVMDTEMHYPPMTDAQPKSLQIGRCTTV